MAGFLFACYYRDMAKNNLPADHHFVPQFLLRNFVDDAGTLHVFDRRTPARGVFNNPPGKVFFERQLYTSIEKDLSKNVDLELAFAHLEGIVAPLITRILDMAKQPRGRTAFKRTSVACDLYLLPVEAGAGQF